MSQNENNTVTTNFRQDPNLSDKWKYRFEFYEQNGLMPFWGSKEYTAKLKALSFGNRLKVIMNIWSFFFPFIYLFILGLWKKALLVIGIIIILNIISLFIPMPIARGLGLGTAAFIASRVNGYYYLLKVKGKQDWSL